MVQGAAQGVRETHGMALRGVERRVFSKPGIRVGRQGLPRPQQSQAEAHVADDVKHKSHAVVLEGPDGLVALTVGAEPLANETLGLVDGLLEHKGGVALVERGRGDLAVQTPERALGRQDVVAVQLQDLVRPRRLRERLPLRRHLVDRLRVVQAQDHPRRRNQQERLSRLLECPVVLLEVPAEVQDTGNLVSDVVGLS